MECLPLKTFEELDSWSSGDLIDCRVSTVPLENRKGKPKGIPKTLVCHDMCGGYLTDRYNAILHCLVLFLAITVSNVFP